MCARQQIQISFGGPLTPMVKKLLIACGVGFVLQMITARAGASPLELHLGLVPYLTLYKVEIWRPFTYIFLHGGVWHLVINCLILYMFGCELERVWGSKFFLKYFFVTGVGAGLCTVLADPKAATITIGASGAIYGLLLGYGLLFPNRTILFMFIIPMKARLFVLIIGAIAFLSAVQPGDSNVAHLAHLGGMLVGYLYLKRLNPLTQGKQAYLKWKLRRMKRRYKIIDGGKRDDDKGPYLH